MNLNALGSGLYKGFFRFDPRGKQKCPERHEANVGIFRLGYLAGWLLKLGLIVVLGPQLVGA